MEDQKILQLFLSRDESAISQTEAKYGSYCASIARNILDSPEDVEEVVSDTWLRTWNSIPPQKPENLKLYLARIVRNLAFDRFRSLHREKRGGSTVTLALEELAHCIPSPHLPGDALAVTELKAAINGFLSTLSGRDREIFLRRYFHVEDFQAIAAACGISQALVRTSLSRTRKKLKHHLIKEGFCL